MKVFSAAYFVLAELLIYLFTYPSIHPSIHSSIYSEPLMMRFEPECIISGHHKVKSGAPPSQA